MGPRYEQTLDHFLMGYRFFAYCLAVILIQVIPGPEVPDQQDYIILSLVGIYTLLKVFSPLRWREATGEAYLVLGGDLVVAMLLILFTNGIDSGYLAYALTPLITASLLMGYRLALTIASITALTPFLLHGILNQFTAQYASLLDGNRLAVLLLYAALGYLIPLMSNRTNLNIRRFIEIDAVLGERRRIKREMHDGVAQALSYLNLQTGAVSKALASNEVARADAGIEDIRSVVRSTYQDIREFLDQLTDEAVTAPLIPTLADYTEQFTRRYSIQVEFEAPEVLSNLSPQGELQLLRIAQEALTNIRKHAQASQVIPLSQSTSSCRLGCQG